MFSVWAGLRMGWAVHALAMVQPVMGCAGHGLGMEWGDHGLGCL